MNLKDSIEMAQIAVNISRLAGIKAVSSYTIASTVAALNRLGREAHTHAENVCNYPMPEGKDEKRRASIGRRAYAALAMCLPIQGVRIEVHGDPRGSCLKVKIPRAEGAPDFYEYCF